MQAATEQLSLFSADAEPDSLSGFTVRESARAKRLSIKVFPRGRVEVVVPRRTRPAEVREFVEAHRDWIQKTRAQFALEHAPEPFALPHTVTLQGIDRVFSVRYREDQASRSVAYRTSDNLVTLTGNTSDETECVTALKRWLISVAKNAYTPQLRELAVSTGNSYRRMHVRGQRTCWGSHSSRGTISLNYCLMFLRPLQLRYVMIHELCHGQHMNHSRRFWDLVGTFEPDYRQLDKELNTCWKQIPTWVGIY